MSLNLLEQKGVSPLEYVFGKKKSSSSSSSSSSQASSEVTPAVAIRRSPRLQNLEKQQEEQKKALVKNS